MGYLAVEGGFEPPRGN